MESIPGPQIQEEPVDPDFQPDIPDSMDEPPVPTATLVEDPYEDEED